MEHNPTDTRPTHQTRRHTRTPCSTDPAHHTTPNNAHQPRTSHITGDCTALHDPHSKTASLTIAADTKCRIRGCN